MESFGGAIWRKVASNFRNSLGARTVLAVEFVVYFGVTFWILAQFGSADSVWDFSYEKLLAAPVALFVMMVIHFAWSWATAPRQIYHEQQAEIAALKGKASPQQLAKGVSTAGPSEADDKATFVRNELSHHAERGNSIEIVADWASWMHGAEEMVKGMAPKHFHTLHIGYPSGSRLDGGDWLLQDAEAISLARSVGTLKVIAANIKTSDFV